MLQNSDRVTLDLLLNLQNMDVLWELFNLSSRNGINKTGLTNTVSTDETVLLTTGQFECGAL